MATAASASGEFPDAAKHEAGYQLERVQAGKEPTDWRPMPSVGLGVSEIRVREGGAFRVIYVAKFPEGDLRASRLREKTARTTKADPDLVSGRYRQW